MVQFSAIWRCVAVYVGTSITNKYTASIYIEPGSILIVVNLVVKMEATCSSNDLASLYKDI